MSLTDRPNVYQLLLKKKYIDEDMKKFTSIHYLL